MGKAERAHQNEAAHSPPRGVRNHPDILPHGDSVGSARDRRFDGIVPVDARLFGTTDPLPLPNDHAHF